MGWMRYIAMALVNTLGVVVGIILVPAPHAVAQLAAETEGPVEYKIWELETRLSEYGRTSSSLDRLETVRENPQSVAQLYELRDRLQAQLDQVSGPPDPLVVQEAWQYELQLQQYQSWRQALRQTESRIRNEEKASQHWKQASQLALEAVEIGKYPNPTVKDWEMAQQLWIGAIDSLRQIPADSLIQPQAIDKIVEYQGYLAIVTYQRALASQPEAEPTATTGEIAQFSVAEPKFPGFALHADVNRDGVIDALDKMRPSQWSLSAGPLILFNNDDDDRSGIPDSHDRIVNGEYDEADLAQIHFKISEEYQDADIYISVDEASRRRINMFQKTIGGWKYIDLSGASPLEFSPTIILGVEAKQFADGQWSGLVNVKAIARKNDTEIASDQIQMGVAPWIMSPNTAPVSQVHISDRGVNQDVVEALQDAIAPTGTPTRITPGETVWMRDSTAIGYVQFPSPDGLRQYNVALSPPGGGDYARSLLGRNFGWAEIGEPREIDSPNQWLDFYGNLNVTPPLPGYPMGRIYYGKADGETINPDILAFLEAQQVQWPPVEIDTSWLITRQVDELITFVPTASGKPLMLVVSPQEGVNLLRQLAQKGYEGAAINRTLSTQTTVRAALNNELLMQHNLRLHREKITPLINQLKQEFKLDDEQIVEVPAMFGYTGYAWWPNPVNSVFVNGKLLVSDPRGALIDGRDYTQEDLQRRLAIAGLEITFLDDTYYQNLRGSLNAGLNTTRIGEEQAFWESFTQQLGQFSQR
ncbi:protein-arginine deiminase [Arthrospira sp. PCC 8006]|uniref:protein-arginine deiminase family protein n=1 Tax=Arthrospira sp. PCC 8006 TaxID=1982224 RepID=UPI00396D581F